MYTHRGQRKQFSELKSLLISSDYKSRSVDATINRARKITGEQALKKVEKSQKSKRLVLVVSFDPTFNEKKHWRGGP